MGLPGKEPTVGQCVSIAVECVDCGRSRWWKPMQLRQHGIVDQTPISTLSQRLICSICRAEGLPGRSVSIQAAFATELDRERASAYLVNSREVLLEESRAIRASRHTG